MDLYACSINQTIGDSYNKISLFSQPQNFLPLTSATRKRGLVLQFQYQAVVCFEAELTHASRLAYIALTRRTSFTLLAQTFKTLFHFFNLCPAWRLCVFIALQGEREISVGIATITLIQEDSHCNRSETTMLRLRRS